MVNSYIEYNVAFAKLGFTISKYDGLLQVQKGDEPAPWSFQFGLQVDKVKNDDEAKELAVKCGFQFENNMNPYEVTGFVKQFHYYENEDEIELFEDLLYFLGHNFMAARRIWQKLLRLNYADSIYTYCEQLQKENQLHDFMGKKYFTDKNGYFFTLNEYKDFLNDVNVMQKIYHQVDAPNLLFPLKDLKV